MAGASYRLKFASPTRQQHARAWLLLATLAVAASSVFAILIVLARVPALGALFPGVSFYRVALTLHVDLSQLVWFMAFAALVWTAAARREPGWLDTLAFGLGAVGAVAMACSPLLGPAAPVMSNYIPVLDTPWFLAGLALYGVAVSIKAGTMLLASIRPASADFYRATLDWGLWLAALCLLCALALLARAAVVMPADMSGLAYFETLFWAAGHVWQFCLVLLMMISWLCCLPPQVSAPPPLQAAALLLLGALPALVALAPGMLWDVGDAAYFGAFTALMQWTTWPAPVLLIGAIVATSRRAPLSVRLSWGLLAAGLVLGALIDGQTTLVTAHYHGTIGAVTVAFMGLSYGLLPSLQLRQPDARRVRIQLNCYAFGNLLMMAGLAGAGWMGAPRKMAGNVGMELSVETLSRMAMGLGGSLAMVGIWMFSWLVLRALSAGKVRSHD